MLASATSSGDSELRALGRHLPDRTRIDIRKIHIYAARHRLVSRNQVAVIGESGDTDGLRSGIFQLCDSVDSVQRICATPRTFSQSLLLILSIVYHSRPRAKVQANPNDCS